ncbi:MAG TPA: site-specific integrase [Rhodothermales bacterium]|nr:site-specific integrase [Rhodothermales bacterium]
MATIRAEARPSKSGRGLLIYLRIQQGRGQRRFVSVGATVGARDWNTRTGEVRRTHPHADAINRTIRHAADAVEAALWAARASGKTLTVDDLKDAALKAVGRGPTRDAPDLLAFMEHQASLAKISTSGGYRAIAAKIKAYAEKRGTDRSVGNTRVAFADVTPAWLEGFDAFLKGKPYLNKDNTRAHAFSVLRAMLSKARAEGLCPVDHRPFDRFKVRWKKTTRVRLSPAQFAQVEAFYETAPPGELRDIAGAFALAVYLLGMRVSDLLELEPRDVIRDKDGRPVSLVYRMTKTGTPKTLTLPRRASRIVTDFCERGGRYILPYLEGRKVETERNRVTSRGAATSALNRDLEKLAAHLGFPRITSHSGRYTFGALALAAGFSRDEIQSAYAHSSGAITEGYLGELNAAALDARIASIFDQA